MPSAPYVASWEQPLTFKPDLKAARRLPKKPPSKYLPPPASDSRKRANPERNSEYVSRETGPIPQPPVRGRRANTVETPIDSRPGSQRPRPTSSHHYDRREPWPYALEADGVAVGGSVRSSRPTSALSSSRASRAARGSRGMARQLRESVLDDRNEDLRRLDPVEWRRNREVMWSEGLSAATRKQQRDDRYRMPGEFVNSPLRRDRSPSRRHDDQEGPRSSNTRREYLRDGVRMREGTVHNKDKFDYVVYDSDDRDQRMEGERYDGRPSAAHKRRTETTSDVFPPSRTGKRKLDSDRRHSPDVLSVEDSTAAQPNWTHGEEERGRMEARSRAWTGREKELPTRDVYYKTERQDGGSGGRQKEDDRSREVDSWTHRSRPMQRPSGTESSSSRESSANPNSRSPRNDQHQHRRPTKGGQRRGNSDEEDMRNQLDRSRRARPTEHGRRAVEERLAEDDREFYRRRGGADPRESRNKGYPTDDGNQRRSSPSRRDDAADDRDDRDRLVARSRRDDRERIFSHDHGQHHSRRPRSETPGGSSSDTLPPASARRSEPLLRGRGENYDDEEAVRTDDRYSDAQAAHRQRSTLARHRETVRGSKLSTPQSTGFGVNSDSDMDHRGVPQRRIRSPRLEGTMDSRCTASGSYYRHTQTPPRPRLDADGASPLSSTSEWEAARGMSHRRDDYDRHREDPVSVSAQPYPIRKHRADRAAPPPNDDVDRTWQVGALPTRDSSQYETYYSEQPPANGRGDPAQAKGQAGQAHPREPESVLITPMRSAAGQRPPY